MATTAAQVGHIWRRLGFGPTRDDIRVGVALGPRALIDQLLDRPLVAFPASGFPGVTAGQDELARRQLELMAWGPVRKGATRPARAYNPVQERVSWVLQGLLVAGVADTVYPEDVRDHLRVLRGALGRSYRSTLRTVITRPAMVKYLTADRNTKDHPNQNLGRELLELFALGRVDPVTGAANYTQDDVVEVSRALSGWRYDWGDGTTYFDASQWDPGAKTFLGRGRGAADLDDVMAAVVAHPSWRRHVPARLYRELTGRTATPAVLTALRSAWGADGDLRALVRAIARRPEFVADATLFNRTKSPVERLVAATRVLRWNGLRTDVGLPWNLARLAQHPMVPPNVSGWPKGDQWLNATSLQVWCLVANELATAGFDWSGAIVGRISPTVRLLHDEGPAATAATRALALAGLAPVSARTRAALTDYATAGAWTPARAAGVMNLVLVSPEFLAN